jgi:hypothetical protein
LAVAAVHGIEEDGPQPRSVIRRERRAPDETHDLVGEVTAAEEDRICLEEPDE